MTGNKIDELIEGIYDEIETNVKGEIARKYKDLSRQLREAADAIDKGLQELTDKPQDANPS